MRMITVDGYAFHQKKQKNKQPETENHHTRLSNCAKRLCLAGMTAEWRKKIEKIFHIMRCYWLSECINYYLCQASCANIMYLCIIYSPPAGAKYQDASLVADATDIASNTDCQDISTKKVCGEGKIWLCTMGARGRHESLKCVRFGVSN